MKGSVFALSVLSVFLALSAIPFMSAVQISMNSGFSQGETLFAQVSGNFLDSVQQSNILLYEGHLRIPFIPSVNKENGVFYVYGQLSGKAPGNYSLVLTGVRYMESGMVKSNDVSKNFIVTNSSADFSIDPGFVRTDAGSSFSINALDLKDSTLTVNYYLQNSSGLQIADVPPGPEKSITFSSDGFSAGSYSAVLSSGNTSYSVPVFLEGSASGPSENSSGTLVSQQPIQIQTSGLNVSMSVNSTTSRYISVLNPSNDSANLSLSASDLILPYVSAPNLTVIGANSSVSVKINITSPDNGSLIFGNINATSGNISVLIPVILNFSVNYSSESSANSSQSLFQSCAQLGGIKCNDGNETCGGEVKNAEDGQCCLGICQAKKSTGNSGKILGWTLAVIALAGVILFFIFRYKKAKRPLNLMKIARRK